MTGRNTPLTYKKKADISYRPIVSSFLLLPVKAIKMTQATASVSTDSKTPSNGGQQQTPIPQRCLWIENVW